MSKLNLSECRVMESPFRYAVLKNFADRDMLMDIDASNLSRMPKAFYVNESVPQIFMNKLDPTTFADGTVISVPCITDFHEGNKGHEGARLKQIELKSAPSGQQALNRCFVDVQNVHRYPEVERLIQELVRPEFNRFLMRMFDVNLEGTALRVELLRNGPGHYLTPHCDCVEKVITLLIFVNENGQPTDSGTDIYRASSHADDTHSSTLDRSFTDFEKVAEVAFETATALLFHPGEDTWHGLDRDKTFDDRRLIQINWVSRAYSTHPECFPVGV